MKKRTIPIVITLLFVLATGLQSCATTPTATTVPSAVPSTEASQATSAPAETGGVIDPSLPPLKIPVGSYLTGSAEAYGELLQPGFDLALEKINSTGGIKGHIVEFDFFDTGYERQQAVTEFIKVATNPDYLVAVGPSSTMEGVAVQGLAAQYKIPFFCFASPSVWPTEFNEWTFRLIPTPSDAIPAIIAKTQSEFGIKKVGMIYDMTDESQVTENAEFKKQFAIAGIEVAVNDASSAGDLSFSAQLTKINAADVDAVIVSLQPMEAGPFMAQARQMGIEAPFIGAGGIGSPDYYPLSAGAAEGTTAYVTLDMKSSLPGMVEFREAYKAKYGEDMSLYSEIAAQAYDALMVVTAVLRAAPELTRESVRETWSSIEVDNLTMGSARWEGSGNPVDLIIFVARMKNGAYEVWE